MEQLTADTLSGPDSVHSDPGAIYQVSMKTTAAGDSKSDDDYDDVWDSDTHSEHLLKLQTELDVLTSRARLVQCDRHCRRLRSSKRRIIEDYEEKWWEQFHSKEDNSVTCNDDKRDSRVVLHSGSDPDYSEVPVDSEDSDYSEIPEYSEVHDHRKATENDDEPSSPIYSEPYEHGEPKEVRESFAKPPTLPARREQQHHSVKKPVWDLKKLKLLYKGSIKKSSKLLPKTLCLSKDEYSKSDCFLGLLGLKS